MRPYGRKLKAPSARFPWGVWLGRYEAYLLTLYGSKTFQYNWPTLERFFDRIHPKCGLERITATDINDYIVWREENNTKPLALLIEVGMLRRFWRWCIEEKGLNLINPVLSAKALQSRYPGLRKPKEEKVEAPIKVRQPIVLDDELYYDLIGGVA